MRIFSRSGAYRIVEGDAAQGRLSHAYLLVCPDGRNLRAFLKELACLILGADRRARDLIGREMFADCLVLPAQGEKFTVADARRVTEESYIRPVEGEKKLFVLDGVQDMNASAQNKLLKVLEEPPASACFLLGSLNDFAVLPTVRSRAKKLELYRFPEKEIARELEAEYPHCRNAAEIAAVSGGVWGRAQLLAEEGGAAKAAEEAARFAAELTVTSAVTAARRYTDREKASAFLAVMRLVYRDILMVRLGREDLLLTRRQEELLSRAAARYSPAALVRAQDKIAETERGLKFNANPSAAMETLFIGILEVR